MKGSARDTAFIDLLTAMKRKLRPIQKSTQASASLSMSTDAGTEANLTYDTEFKVGKGKEFFVFHVSDGMATLRNYRIESLDLITK